MPSYRLKRRAFIAGLGSAFGARLILKNMEAAAVDTPPPPRLLVAYWPGGTVHYDFTPTGSGFDYTPSRILQPFEDLGLRQDLIVLNNMHTRGLSSPSGGASESGVVLVMTGASSPGTRSNGGEPDDSIAGGPSFDQIFLRHVTELQTPGQGYANVICDARVDSNETSSRCLSYAYDQREVTAAGANAGATLVENIPLLPTLSPFELYTSLFAGFSSGATDAEMLKTLYMKKSVLDSASRDLERLRTLAPTAESHKIDLHAEAIRNVELQLSATLRAAETACPQTAPLEPDPTLLAKTGNSFDYSDPRADAGDEPHLERLAADYMALIGVAFQCDLLRVATFQWCSSTNHVAFQGLYPADPDGAYMHHPLGSRVLDSRAFTESRPDGDAGDVLEFLVGAQTWFNQKLGEHLARFKTLPDPFGGNLLDHTVVPYLTEKAHMADAREPLPGLIIGGRGLGLRGGQFYGEPRHINDLWMTVAQALMQQQDPLSRLAEEAFMQTDVAPIAGLWEAP